MSDQRTRQGKIARLPATIREEVNRRLYENEGGAKIVAWINSQDEVLKILDEYFHEEPVSPQNLSEWKKGGYQDWLKRRERLDNLKNLSSYALKLGQAAGGSVADGSAAVLGGRIMEMIESADDDDLSKLGGTIFRLQIANTEKAKVENQKAALKQRDKVIAQRQEHLELERQRFQVQTCEIFMKWYDNKKAKEIIDSRGSNAEKIELLGRELFGEHWRK